ncbi:MAG: 16S rRNA (cytidine(1402)-2'-O)-methyltransferase [Clostridia bacterium]|nr:16S rRNA (cytidine(1402)-2'-O)-methyltransferase [Clostridia bacterium]
MAVSDDQARVGSLTLVGTPIGNLSDFSPRAQEALAAADVIAAEDTRVSLKLLNHFGIKKPLVSYFEHNRHTRGEELIARMQAGERVALVTDAGMPAISDPGQALVAACHEQGIPVHVVPGPTAVTTAVALSGLPSARFTFEGFLSTQKRERREHLQSLTNEPRTLVLYEAPHKLRATLRDLLDALGNRRLAIVRELTKIHEEVQVTTLKEATKRYETEEPRGEIVLVIEGAPAPAVPDVTLSDAAALARTYIDAGDRPADAAKKAAGQTGHKKNEIYKQIVE